MLPAGPVKQKVQNTCDMHILSLISIFRVVAIQGETVLVPGWTPPGAPPLTRLQALLREDCAAAADAAKLGRVGQDLPRGVELLRAEPDLGRAEPDRSVDIVNFEL